MDSTKEQRLFEEFPGISTQEWEKLIYEDLKGADYEKKLVWKTDEGLSIKPYYRAEDLENLEYLNQNPNAQAYVRGNKTHNNNWTIVQEITEPDPVKANKIAVNAISRGAETVCFDASKVNNASDMQHLLAGINAEVNGISFNHASSYPALVDLFISELIRQDVDLKKVTGSIDFDPVNYLLLHTKFYTNQENDLNETLFVIKKISENLPAYKALKVNGGILHNCGANIVQEMAYALAWGNDYLAHATSKGTDIDQIAQTMEFNFSIGSNYFLEIAKFRAVRMLWAMIVEQYKPLHEASKQMRIHAQSSVWNKSLYDPNVNMLRMTTEGMSAAIAGCDSITLNPYDNTFKNENEFSSRIARNVQLILKYESYFDKVIDPSAGSYYIENITDQLAEQAWKLFQSVEANGGFIKNVENKNITSEIEKTAAKRNADIATRKTIVLGTNQYCNTAERMHEAIEIETNKTYPGLNPYRRSEVFEKLRFETEAFEKKCGRRPVVFLFTIGNLGMRKARASFATNLFGCAGYEIIDNLGFKSVEAGVEKALADKADIIVVCSSDEEYAEFVPAVRSELDKVNSKAILVVAGYPKELLEKFNEIGVDKFIHVRSNLLDELVQYNKLLGI